jgi:glycosyltransferase involved in cell wall biosynthesis
MILGVNGIRLVVHRSGVARVIEAILRNLDRLEHPFTDIRIYTPTPLDAGTYLPGGARNVVLPSRLPRALWEQVTLPRAHGGRGLLLCPSYIQPLFPGAPTFLIHHGSYEGYPQAFDSWTLRKAHAMYALSAWRASGVSTVSAYSRRDMERFYRIPESRVAVVPNGVDTAHFRPLADQAPVEAWRRTTFRGEVPFITYVGKPTERRNLSALIRAFGELKRAHAVPHKLLIVGAAGPGTSPFRDVVAELGLGDDVVIKGQVTHEEMLFVYNGATCLVYPSSYEGFGMPVLEAMACGTPVIALDNTAFPEFAGGVAMLLPDAQVPTLVAGIKRVMDDSTLRARMAADGPERAASYDWKIVTQRYLDLMIPIARAAEQA